MEKWIFGTNFNLHGIMLHPLPMRDEVVADSPDDREDVVAVQGDRLDVELHVWHSIERRDERGLAAHIGR